MPFITLNPFYLPQCDSTKLGFRFELGFYDTWTERVVSHFKLKCSWLDLYT
jgi:hypothetical protein